MTTKSVNFFTRLLTALPLLSFLLGLVAWLCWGMDIPWFDDWRGYADGSMGSLKLEHLFQPTNDTLSPIGFALDALALRYLNGNSIVYQFLSMAAVLGSLLILQWTLLSRVLDNKLHVAICFSFTALMLQPGSYWGLENLAYYQGLPLTFILSALWLITQPARSSLWRGPVIAVLGLLAGLTYISGAFGALAAGVALIAIAGICYSGAARRQLMREATWFTAAAAVTAVAQFYFSVFKFRSMHAGIPLAWPTQIRFWAFYLGKLARSLVLPPQWPWASLIMTVMVWGILAVTVFFLTRRAAKPQGTAAQKRLALIYIPLVVTVLVYLMLVAAGRTNVRPPEMQRILEIFTLGFSRFHFFWATLIWPWTAAALIVLSRHEPWFDDVAIQRSATVFVLILALLIGAGGAYDHMARQRQIAGTRESVARCLLSELQRGGEVRCPGLLPPYYNDAAPDAYPAYLYAKKAGASFVRYFPLLPTSKRRESLAAFYRLDGSTAQLRMNEMEALGKGVFRALGTDSQLYIQTGQPQITRHCAVLDVDVEMKAGVPDTAQFFFAPKGDFVQYREELSVEAAVGGNPGALQTLSFRLESDTGFFESFRFDPVRKPQELEIHDIRLYCVRALP